MESIGFMIWDAPRSGNPRSDLVSTAWGDGELVMVTLSRSHDTDKELADVSILSMDPGIGGNSHGVSALLSFAKRFAAARGIGLRDATKALIELADQPGTPVTLTLNDSLVTARRHDVPETGDWVVTAVDLPVAVAGLRGIELPELESADLTLWENPLIEQVAQAHEDALDADA